MKFSILSVVILAIGIALGSWANIAMRIELKNLSTEYAQTYENLKDCQALANNNERRLDYLRGLTNDVDLLLAAFSSFDFAEVDRLNTANQKRYEADRPAVDAMNAEYETLMGKCGIELPAEWQRNNIGSKEA